MNLDNVLEELNNNTIYIQNISDEIINNILNEIRIEILNNKEYLLTENKKDVEISKDKLSKAMLDRLTLTEKIINNFISSIDFLINEKTIYKQTLEILQPTYPIKINKVAYPFGVILAIFEARPNVCLDIAILALKSHNCCILKGGKECINTNMAIVSLINKAINKYIDKKVLYLIRDNSHDIVNYLLTKKDLIDLVIPRGSKSLIDYVVNTSKIPYIETGAGNCHLYIDYDANIDMAIKIAINAKYDRPSVCNSIETILVSKAIANIFLPILKTNFDKLNIEIRADEITRKIIDCNSATEDDYYKEYNDYIVAVKIVDDVDMAINHINKYSSHHSEAIISNDKNNVTKFFNEVDSACLYHNASTRFSDGGCFGYGLELGISTAKMHSRGPMGVNSLFTYKYLIEGNGDIRK